jgi:hypothetical protein
MSSKIVMKYNLVHKLLSIETNQNRIYYFPFAPSLDKIIKGSAKLRLGFYVKDFDKPKELTQNFDFYWGKTGSKKLYYEHHILPGLKAKMLLDMSKEVWTLTVNKPYYKLAKYKFENVWPPGRHFTSLVIGALLKNNLLPIHSAAISDKKSKEAYLLLGASNTGKSYTTFSALEKGYDYHSEDLAILDEHYVYKIPLISAMSDKLPNKNVALRYNLLAAKLIGLNVFLPVLDNNEVFRKFFKGVDLNSKARISKIFILEKNIGGVRKISPAEASRKILILNKLEMNYYVDQMLLSYSYFNKDFSVDGLEDAERKLVKKITAKSDCYLVSSRSPDNFFPLIEKVLSK